MELKKVNSKHILKSTLTPQMQRKSASVDCVIDKDVSPTIASKKMSRRENVSISILLIRYSMKTYYT